MLEEIEKLIEEVLTPQGDVLALAIQGLAFAVALVIAPVLYRFLAQYFERLVVILGKNERVHNTPQYN